MEKYRESVKHFKKAISINPRDFNYSFQLSSVYLALKEYEKALFYLNQTLILDPSHRPALKCKYHVLKKLSRFEEMIQMLPRIRKYAPSQASYWQELGSCYMNLKQMQKAIKCVKKAVKLEPNNHAYNFTLAALYMNQKDNKKALFYTNKAIVLDSSNKYAWRFKYEILKRMGKTKKANEVKKKFKQIFKRKK